jgi:hypothetical protein
VFIKIIDLIGQIKVEMLLQAHSDIFVYHFEQTVLWIRVSVALDTRISRKKLSDLSNPKAVPQILRYCFRVGQHISPCRNLDGFVSLVDSLLSFVFLTFFGFTSQGSRVDACMQKTSENQEYVAT